MMLHQALYCFFVVTLKNEIIQKLNVDKTLSLYPGAPSLILGGKCLSDETKLWPNLHITFAVNGTLNSLTPRSTIVRFYLISYDTEIILQ